MHEKAIIKKKAAGIIDPSASHSSVNMFSETEVK
jgi:hypothetical protein